MAYTTYSVITATAGAGTNLKGAYTQVVASTPYASSRLFVLVEFANIGVRFFLVDLATGGAGAETVVVSNIAVDSNLDTLTGVWVPVSVDIPAGTRLSVRIQAGTASHTLTMTVLLESRALASVAAPVTYGANTAFSRGTQVDPGTTSNTKGSYVQLSASTSSRIDALVLCITIGGAGTAITTGIRWLIDIATGGAGAETVVIPDLTAVAGPTSDAVRPGTLWLPVSIPAGTRLAARCSSTTNTALMRLLCVTLIGMQEPASAGGSAAAVAYVG